MSYQEQSRAIKCNHEPSSAIECNQVQSRTWIQLIAAGFLSQHRLPLRPSASESGKSVAARCSSTAFTP